MPRRSKAPARPTAPAPDNTLYQFATDFFAVFGVVAAQVGTAEAPVLELPLTPELAVHFGSEQLTLRFHGAEPKPGQELVAHGSRIFDRMLSYLERRSAFTLRRLPARTGGGETLMSALRPLNASVHDLRIQEQVQWLFFFTWRLTYRADDKRQELYTVALNQDGQRLHLVGEAGASADAVDQAQLLADATAIEPEQTPEGDLLPPRLLPLVQLVKLAETARKYAVYHADLRCVSHEGEILPRLHKTLNRLTTYYQQQIEEVYNAHDPDGEKRQALEADLERKIAEEVENHRLRVQVELLSYVAVESPVTALTMTLSDGRRSAPVEVMLDRYTGQVQRPLCYSCGAALTAVALDRSGHLICDACIGQCSSCQEIVCPRCGVEPCPVCQQPTCSGCGRTCWACGGRACAGHISRCPTCGDEVCHACQGACAACGTRQCRSHLHADAVPGPDGTVQLICAVCAVRCPGCSQYTAQLGTCDASGQRFCRNCLVTCHGCRRSVGPGFYTRSPVDQQPYCQSCQRECVACGRITPVEVTCHTCGATGCPACTPRCNVCGEYVCSAHSQVIAGCGHLVCTTHSLRCAIGKEAVCPACSVPCAICERPHCREHARTCAQCNQEYCSECVRASGLCDTCATVARQGISVTLRSGRWPESPAAEQLIPHYHWKFQSNTRYTIYYGEGVTMNAAVIVVRVDEQGEQVIHTRRISAIDRLRGLLGL